MADMRGKHERHRKLPEFERRKRDDVEIEPNAIRHGLVEDLVTRRANVPIVPASYSEEAGTVEALISTGAPVRRRDARGTFVERLDLSGVISDELVGIPVLDSHRQGGSRDTIGVIVSARHEPEGLVAVIRLSQADDVKSVRTKIVEGVLRAFSIGYGVARRTEAFLAGERVVTVVPIIREASVVAIGADPAARIRSKHMEPETETLDPPAAEPTVTENRAAIRGIARAAGLPTSWADDQIDVEATPMEARAAAFEEMQTRSRQTPRIRTTAPAADDPAMRFRAMEDALHAHVTGAMPADAARADAARPFVGHSLRDFARESLTMRGVSTVGMDVDTLFRAAMHTTSDFPNLLTGVGRRTLLAAYTAAASPLKTLARQGGRVDFRTGSTVRLGEIGALQKVSEAGEIKHVSRAEAAEAYALDTYGALFSLSRKALVNDDLGAFNDWSSAAGQAAAQTEAALLWALLSQGAGAGPGMSDGKRLFHVDHGNLLTGAALDIDSLSDARLAMRKTKGLDGKTIINATPKYLVVGPELETVAEQVLAAIYAQTPADANPFTGKLTLLVEPRITDDQWFVFADPSQVPVLEYSYLSSAPGPQLASREGWDVLSVEYRVYEDFGCGALDWRGAVRNPGV